jgi:hypothetical protein
MGEVVPSVTAREREALDMVRQELALTLGGRALAPSDTPPLPLADVTRRHCRCELCDVTHPLPTSHSDRS